jgi:hypothetical protein
VDLFVLQKEISLWTCEAPRENQLKSASGYIGGAQLPVGSWHLPWICRGAAGVGCPRLEVEGFYEYPAVSVAVGQWPDERHQSMLFPFLLSSVLHGSILHNRNMKCCTMSWSREQAILPSR